MAVDDPRPHSSPTSPLPDADTDLCAGSVTDWSFVDTASVGRISGLIGDPHGVDGMGVDRAVLARLLHVVPDIAVLRAQKQDFLRRVLRILAHRGITQYLDLGCGSAGGDRLGPVVHRHSHDWRCVYVDTDPVCVARRETELDSSPFAPAWEAVLAADLLDPDTLWPQVLQTGLIDPTEPVALVMSGVTHHLADTDALTAAVSTHAQWVAPGSCLLLTHLTQDTVEDDDRARLDAAAELVAAECGVPLVFRGPGEIADLMGPFSPVEPGVVPVTGWDPHRCNAFVTDPRLLGALGVLACPG